MVHDEPGGLQRHFGLLQATALNVTMIVGAGVFVTVPLMLKELPGPYALLGWLAAGALMLVDGMIWSELAATLPGSGGSYLYLLESFGRNRWGRLMAFLFIWQFLISGPLEVGSGLIAMAQFANDLSPDIKAFNEANSREQVLFEHGKLTATVAGGEIVFGDEAKYKVTVNPLRLAAFAAGCGVLWLLYRRVTVLGRLTVAIWAGVLAIIAWILLEGWLRFNAVRAFAMPDTPPEPAKLGLGIGATMILAMYSYLGYYNVCYVGDEVRDPGRTLPRAILLSGLLVCVLFLGLHLAMLGTVSWQEVPRESPELDTYNLPAEFMRRVHGEWAARVVAACLIWSCFGSVFAALLGYSRIPYGAARYGHFFAALGKVHPTHHIPHVSLLLVGGLTLFWTFFDLQNVINALITTRILEQFIGQIVGVMLLRKMQPDRPRPYRIWLYPLPCFVALVGWLYMYLAAGLLFIAVGLMTLTAGAAVFFVWTWWTRRWPFPPLAA